MTSVPSSVSNCIRHLGLVCGVDSGPVGEDLEGPGPVPPSQGYTGNILAAGYHKEVGPHLD